MKVLVNYLQGLFNLLARAKKNKQDKLAGEFLTLIGSEPREIGPYIFQVECR